MGVRGVGGMYSVRDIISSEGPDVCNQLFAMSYIPPVFLCAASKAPCDQQIGQST